MKQWPALRLRFTPSTTTEMPLVQELVAAALDDLTPTAVQESESEWVVFFATGADRDRAAAALPIVAPGSLSLAPVDIADDDWAKKSQEGLGPVRVGRVIITPPWHASAGPRAVATAPAPITIVIEPSMGFGTGHHPSTRLCTALLQNVDLAGKTVLDVGTGSGILALVAHALGARSVHAVDNDPDALETARQNLERNGVKDGVTLDVADFRLVPSAPADVVTANLTGALLVRAADVLARAVAPRGTLIVSGVLREEEADVVAALSTTFTLVERLTEDEWIGARLSRA